MSDSGAENSTVDGSRGGDAQTPQPTDLPPVIETIGDIDELVRARELLQADHARLRATMDSLLDPHVLMVAVRGPTDACTDFRCVDANQAACADTRTDYDSLVGSTLADMFPGPQGEQLRQDFVRVVESGEPLVLDDYAFLPDPLGGVRSYFDIRATKVNDGLAFTWRNVSDRRAAAVALAAAESQYRLLAENATDVVILISPDWSLSWVSPATTQVLGYEPAELIGTDTKDLIHPEDLSVLFTLRAPINQGAARVHYDLRVRHASGEYRWMSGVSRLAFDSEGAAVGRISTLRDTHEQVLAQRALARSEHMFRLAMDGAPQGMAVVGLHLAFLEVNGALCALLGRDEHWLMGHTIRDVVHPDDLEEDLSGRDELLSGSLASRIRECRWLKSDGTAVWVLQSTGLLRDEQGMPLFYVSHIQDNTDAHRAKADLAYRANHDPLTGLINRAQLQDYLEGILAFGRRVGGVPGLLFCDLDFFKNVNDVYGHAVGDEVLKETAERIAGSLRSSDVVARLGGDEFVAVLPQVRDAAAAAEIGEKIRAAVALPMRVAGVDGEVVLTMSIGIALASEQAQAQGLLHNADQALYAAKQSVRDRIVVFPDPVPSADVVR